MTTPYRTRTVTHNPPTQKYRCWVSHHPFGVTNEDGIGFTSNWFVLCWFWGQYMVWKHPMWSVDIQTRNESFQPGDATTGRELIERS